MDIYTSEEDQWSSFFEKCKDTSKSIRILNPKEPSPFQVPLHAFPQQPWARHPNPSAWFNQGLNAQTWPQQASQQAQVRQKILQLQTKKQMFSRQVKKPLFVGRKNTVSDSDFLFIVQTLNDPRSWFGYPQFPQIAIDTDDVSKAHWIVGFATPDELAQVSDADDFAHLSVTFLERNALGQDLKTPVTLFNWTNWNRVPPKSTQSSLDRQRQYVINHEFGHVLGEGHRKCDPKEGFAPIMLQQTKGLYGCRENPWPLPYEVQHATRHGIQFL